MNTPEVDKIEMGEDITPELRATIEQTVKELKEKDSKLKAVFPIVIDGEEEYGDKPQYVGYFRRPTYTAMSKYMTFAQKDSTAAMRQLAKDCFLAGDRELVDDDDLFMFGTMAQFGEIMKVRNGRLVNLSKPGK